MQSLGDDFGQLIPGAHSHSSSSSSSHSEKTINGEKVEDESALDKIEKVDGEVVDEEHKRT